MGKITDEARALREAQELAAGHADAAHSGVLDSDCERCVALAADCGVNLRHAHDVARFAAWRAQHRHDGTGYAGARIRTEDGDLSVCNVCGEEFAH